MENQPPAVFIAYFGMEKQTAHKCWLSVVLIYILL